MTRCTYSDFDEFADTMSGLDGRYLQTAPSESDWWINPGHVARLKLQRLQVGAPTTFAGDGPPGELSIGISTSLESVIQIDGAPMSADSFLLVRNNQPMTFSAQGATLWDSVTLTHALLAEQPFLDPSILSVARLSPTLVRANYSALRRVSLLLGWLCNENEDLYFADSVSVAAAEEDLLIAVAGLLRTSACIDDIRSLRPRIGRDRIVARCLEYLRANLAQPILVGDLCRAAGVSERTLRNVFVDYFGIGPTRFVKVRQVHEIRKALLQAEPEQTVPGIVARFGVWDLKSFARNYKALFGEDPSTTFRQGAGRAATTAMGQLPFARSWAVYASRRFTDTTVEI